MVKQKEAKKLLPEGDLMIPGIKEEKPPEEAGALPVINPDTELDKLSEDMPRVEEEAIKAAQDKAAIAPGELPPAGISDALDKLGRRFDPAIHSIYPDGKPRLTVDGYLMQKRGNKAKIIYPDKTAGAGINLPGIDQEAINRRYTAEVSAGLFIQTGVVFFGDEWQPDKSKDFDERLNLVNATDDYFKIVGFKQLPPWAGLAMAYSSYAFRRINKPVTKTKIQSFGQRLKDKIALWWINRKNKKPAKKEAANVTVEVKEICDCKDRINIPMEGEVCSQCKLKRK